MSKQPDSMKIVQRKTEELIPYERNQKVHDEKQIRNVANSIKRFGWKQPIVVDAKDVIIIGHCRWEAAKELGLETVPVVVADNLTEDEVRELRIVDNKTNESPWDFENLKIDINELDFDFTDFGFNEFELIDLKFDEPKQEYPQAVSPAVQSNYENKQIVTPAYIERTSDAPPTTEEKGDDFVLSKEEINAYKQNAEQNFTSKRVIITYRTEEEEAYLKKMLLVDADKPISVVYIAETILKKLKEAQNNE